MFELQECNDRCIYSEGRSIIPKASTLMPRPLSSSCFRSLSAFLVCMNSHFGFTVLHSVLALQAKFLQTHYTPPIRIRVHSTRNTSDSQCLSFRRTHEPDAAVKEGSEQLLTVLQDGQVLTLVTWPCLGLRTHIELVCA